MTQEPTDTSEPVAPKRFNPLIALQGGHRPSRVVSHGLGYLIGFPLVVYGLFVAGAIHAIIRGLRYLGMSSGIVGTFPTLLLLAYLVLWAWFLCSLFKCARNAETPRGMKTARRTSMYLGVATAIVIGVTTIISTVH
jgi:hypothetical protein